MSITPVGSGRGCVARCRAGTDPGSGDPARSQPSVQVWEDPAFTSTACGMRPASPRGTRMVRTALRLADAAPFRKRG